MYNKEIGMLYKKNKTKNISFPLGGIGTGCIGLAGNGSLVEWEIFNRPNKNSYNGYSHFAIKVEQNGKSQTKVLQGDAIESLFGMHNDLVYVGYGNGPHCNSMAGFPHFKDVKFEGTFPLARLTFSEKDFPVSVKLTAFNPFIPHDEFNSSIPGAFFEWEVENLTSSGLECAISLSVQNPNVNSINEEFDEKFSGILFKDNGHNKDEIGYCDLCAITDQDDAHTQAYWLRGPHKDPYITYWNDLSCDRRIKKRNYTEARWNDHGSLVAYVKVEPRKTKKIRFVITWNVPNQYNYWNPCKDEKGSDVTWKNYYATQFENSKASAIYSMENFEKLFQKTKLFSDSLQSCSLKSFVKDAISSNLSVLKTPTVLRLEDGSLWGWEGCFEKEGSCEGSCQHVWNYAYVLPFLFPKLERSLRENTIKYALLESGKTKFRVPLPVGRDLGEFRSCLDGQMGEVIKCYREWKLSGDNDWIKERANSIFKMLEFAWSKENEDGWDLNEDGVLEGRQHHTLDLELFGPSSWLQGFYLLALDCGAEIARSIGDSERANKYVKLYNQGKRWTNENLFNGEYFYHKIDLKDKSIVDKYGASDYWGESVNEIKYQVANGCIIDQMLADWHAVILGRDEIFDKEKKCIALKNLYKYNYHSSMREVLNLWRIFAVDDEGGAIICSYPKKENSPKIPILYTEECMTGFEYALAGLMIANGYVEEGETIVKAVRDRYDGEKRNPWNEIECGANYARSMASFALMTIYSGFSFDMTKKRIGFNPLTSTKSRYLWGVADTWGKVDLTKKKHVLTVLGEELKLCSYTLPDGKTCKKIKVDGKIIDFSMDKTNINFDCVTIKNKMEIEIK